MQLHTNKNIEAPAAAPNSAFINKETLGLLLCGGFFFTFFSGQTPVLNGILLGLMGLWGLFYNSLREKWSLLKQSPHLWTIVLFFIWLWVSLFLSENKSRGFRYMDTRLSLFYLPVSMGLLSLTRMWRNKALLIFSWVTTAAMLYCLLVAAQAAHRLNDASLLYNDSLTLPLYRQSAYVALLVNIALFVQGWWLFMSPLSRVKKTLLFVNIIFLLVASYLLASRNMLLVLCVGTVGFVGYYIFSKKAYLVGFTLLLGLFMVVFAVFKIFPKTGNRFKEFTYTRYDYNNQGKESHYNMAVDSTQWNGVNLRLAIWSCGWELFKRQPLAGVGLGDKQDALFEKYKEKQFAFAYATKKSVHSNFVDVLYSTGAIGFLLFFAGWVLLPVVYVLKKEDGLGFLMVLTIVSAMVTEIYFDRTIGSMICGFFIPFVLNTVLQEKEKNKAAV